MKFLSLLLFVYTISFSQLAQHPADPNGELAPYSIFGMESVELKGNCETAYEGWIGSTNDLIIGDASGICKIHGKVITIGSVDADNSIFDEEYKDDGESNFQNVTFEKNAQATSVTNGSSWSPDSLLTIVKAAVLNPTWPSNHQIFADSKNTENATDCSWNGTVWSCTNSQILPPGTYGNINIGSDSAWIGAGEYYFESFSMTGSGGLLVHKEYSEATRIIIRDDFGMSGGYIQTEKRWDYGKVMIYVDDYNENSTVQISPGVQIDATLYAPFSTIRLNPNIVLNGQVLGKKVEAWSGFNGASGVFIPFDPPTILFDKSFSLKEEGGTRYIELPISLDRAIKGSCVAQFDIRPSTSANPATEGQDYTLPLLSGKFKISVGERTPSSPIQVQIIDDSLPEELEYIELRIYTPYGALLEGNQDTNTYLIPLISNDGNDSIYSSSSSTTSSSSNSDSTSSSSSSSSSSSDNNVTQSSSTTISASSSSYEDNPFELTNGDSLNTITNGTGHIVDDTLFTNNPDDPIILVTQAGDTIRVDPIPDENGMITLIDSTTGDTLGTIPLIVDTTPPIVKILSPSQNAYLTSESVDVEWTVDGEPMDWGILEHLQDGEYSIIRSVTDKAGNTGSDTVTVQVVLPIMYTRLFLLNSLIQSSSENKDLRSDFFELKGRYPEKGEVVSLSFLKPSSNKVTEILRSGASGLSITNDTKESPEYDIHRFANLGLVLELDLRFPVGENVDPENPATSTCTDTKYNGLPTWEHSIEYMTVSVFDNLGHFVFNFTIQQKIQISPEEFQNKEGLIKSFLEIPMGNSGLHTDSGRLWGTGAYILRVEITTQATAINCNTSNDLIMQSGTMNTFGYIRN